MSRSYFAAPSVRADTLAAFHMTRTARLLLAPLTVLSVVACGSMDNASRRVASAVTPYRMEIVQGNFVSREQVEALKPGMTRLQVRDILGTPLVTSVFHANRWEYAFTLERAGVTRQARKLTVFFKGDALDHFEGDPMPSESEFVNNLETQTKPGPVPSLTASEEALARFTAANPARPKAPAPKSAAATAYPPLESTPR